MIRAAKHEDVPAMLAIMEKRYRASAYADVGEMSIPAAKKLLNLSILAQWKQDADGTLVMVAERDGEVAGFIIGMLEHVYLVGVPLSAKDLFFVARPGADWRDVVGLAEAFAAWATSNPRVVEIMMGCVDMFGADPAQADALYRRLGLDRCGAIYRRSIDVQRR